MNTSMMKICARQSRKSQRVFSEKSVFMAWSVVFLWGISACHIMFTRGVGRGRGGRPRANDRARGGVVGGGGAADADPADHFVSRPDWEAPGDCQGPLDVREVGRCGVRVHQSEEFGGAQPEGEGSERLAAAGVERMGAGSVVAHDDLDLPAAVHDGHRY